MRSKRPIGRRIRKNSLAMPAKYNGSSIGDHANPPQGPRTKTLSSPLRCGCRALKPKTLRSLSGPFMMSPLRRLRGHIRFRRSRHSFSAHDARIFRADGSRESRLDCMARCAPSRLYRPGLRPPISTLTVLARRGEVAMDSRERDLRARRPPQQAENGIEADFDES